MKRNVTIIALLALLFFAPSVFAENTFEGKEIKPENLKQYLDVVEGLYKMAHACTDVSKKIEMFERVKQKSVNKKGIYFNTEYYLGLSYLSKSDTISMELAAENFIDMVNTDSGHPWIKQLVYPALFPTLLKQGKYSKALGLSVLVGNRYDEIKCDILMKNFNMAQTKINELTEKGDIKVIELTLGSYVEASAETEGIKILDEYIGKLSKGLDKKEILENSLKDEKDRTLLKSITNGYFELGKALRHKKHYSESNELLQKTKEIINRNTEVYREALKTEGDNWADLQEPIKSITCYTEIIEGKNNTDALSRDIYIKLAGQYMKKNKVEEALNVYKQFNDIEGIADCLNLLGRHNEAIEMIDKMIEELEK